MKNLKSILLASVITVGAFSAVVVSSCNPDECKDIICQNGGTCTDGTCNCPGGYEGEFCQTRSNLKFVNSAGWLVTEDGTSSAPASYTVDITASSTNPSAIFISNFWDTFVAQVNATVNGNEITIPRQEPDNDDYFVQGTGTIDTVTGKITMKYKVTDETTATIITDDFGVTAGAASIWTKK